MSRSDRVSAFAYGVSLACLAAAVFLRWLLDPVLGDTLPLPTVYAAVGVAVWIGGYRPAVLVAMLGYLACAYLFISPRGHHGLDEPRNIVGFLVFLATASIIIGFGEALRRARQRHREGEEAALEQADLLRTTLASIGDGVIVTDADGRVTSMNAVARSLTGWAHDEAVGVEVTQVFRIVNESTRQEVENPALRALEHGMIAALANHTVLIARDGTERPIEDSAAPIRGKNGKIVGSVVVFRDISERHRAEAERRDSQRQVASSLESVTDGFIQYDRDWRMVYVNAEAERINKLPRSQMLGKTIWEVFPAVVGTKLEFEFRRAVAERVTVEFENHYEPFGRWYSLKGYPTADGGMTAYIRDITEQKHFEERLRESEARYRAIGESIDYGVWVCDAAGRNTYASDSFLRMVGITQQQCSDFGWGDVLHPGDAEQTIAAWKECVRTQGRWDRVHRFKGVDGRWHHVLARGVPLRDASGQALGWAGLNLDISRMMQAEEEIVRLAAESERQRRLYETVLTNTPDFVYVFSLDHRVLYANEALIKMWGRGRDGAIGKTFLEIGYEPWHAQMHDREIDQVRATRQPIRGEVPFNGTHGRRQYDYIFVPVIGADGEVEAVAGTTRDITERKQTEDQLRRNHDTFFALIQNNPFGVYVVDADFCLRQVSLGAQKVFETIRPLLGRDFAEVLRTLWPEPFASEAIGRFRHTLDTGEPYSAPSTIQRRVDIGAMEAYDWRIERISMPDGRYGVVCYFYDLSERQRWETTLRNSEERLRLATDAAELGIWTWQPQGDLVVWENDRPYEIFGLPRTEPPVTAAKFKADFLHPEDTSAFELAFARAEREKAPLWCECRIRRTDGETRWVEFTGRAVEDAGNVRLIGTVRDITASKRAEEAIRASDAQHSFMVKLADALRPLSDPVAVQAEASRVLGERTRANRVAYFEVHGKDFVVGRDYTDGVSSIAGSYPIGAFGLDLLAAYQAGRTATESDVDMLQTRTPGEKEAFAAIQIKSYVGVPLVKDGVLVAGLAVHASSVRTWTPTEIAIIEETADRTWAAVERVRAEDALRASEERRLLALEAAELGAWHIDLATNTLTTDERFRLILAGTSEEVGYEQAFAAIHPDDRERIRDAVAAATRSDDPLPFAEEYRVSRPDGSVRWVFAKGRKSDDREGPGGSLSFDGTVADITARKCIEQERERLLGQLRDADRRKDEFMATLAHELRNPLAPIRTGLEVMRLAGATGKIEQARAMMERQLTLLVRLVDDLLDMSRVTSGKLELRKEPVELKAVIAAAVETSRPAIEQARHELAVDMQEESILVDGDATRLAQVVSNLLNNSAKYTHPGGHIALSVRRTGTTAVVSVKDDGIGIPPAMLDKVFLMFTQVDRALEKTTDGLGIGLSLVKGLVEMHGGTIEARSEGEGRGSEFIVRLPVLPSGAHKVEPPVVDEPASLTTRRRILIADDNVDSATSLGFLLELLGNDVSTAHDGLQAVDMAGSVRPDVIVLDIGMPKLNGYEACRRIREQVWGRHAIVVALTGWGQDHDKRRSQEAGFDAHLVKPVDPVAFEKLLLSLKAATA